MMQTINMEKDLGQYRIVYRYALQSIISTMKADPKISAAVIMDAVGKKVK